MDIFQPLIFGGHVGFPVSIETSEKRKNNFFTIKCLHHRKTNSVVPEKSMGLEDKIISFSNAPFVGDIR